MKPGRGVGLATFACNAVGHAIARWTYALGSLFAVLTNMVTISWWQRGDVQTQKDALLKGLQKESDQLKTARLPSLVYYNHAIVQLENGDEATLETDQGNPCDEFTDECPFCCAICCPNCYALKLYEDARSLRKLRNVYRTLPEKPPEPLLRGQREPQKYVSAVPDSLLNLDHVVEDQPMMINKF